MLFDTCCNSQDIRIEDNIFGRNADLIHQYFIGTPAYFDASFESAGLTLFVECHHHHSSSVIPNFSCMFPESIFTFLHADRIYDSFALQAF